MAIDTYLVRYRVDSNPHNTKGDIDAMDILHLRVATSSVDSAKEYVKNNRPQMHSIIDVKLDNPKPVYCDHCGQEIVR